MSIKDLIIRHLKENELHYKEPDESHITLSFNADYKLSTVKERILIHDDYFSLYAMLPINIEESARPAVAEYITRANYGLRFGNFEMDYSDGEIRYKMTVDCEDIEVSDSIIRRAIGMPVAMFERYGNGLAAIALGFSDPETEIQKAEADD